MAEVVDQPISAHPRAWQSFSFDQKNTSASSLFLVVTGMAKEMRLASGPGSIVLGSGGNPAKLREAFAALGDADYGAVLSFGIAGGLDPTLRPGDVIVAISVTDEKRRWPCERRMTERLASILIGGEPSAGLRDIAGVNDPLLQAADKRALGKRAGAAAVDMESHIAAEFAASRRVPFAAIRVVCDPVSRSLPPLVTIALGTDGRLDYRAIAGSLVRNPGQLAAMPRLAADARAAFAGLRRCRDLLGIGRGFPDLRELLGDVA